MSAAPAITITQPEVAAQDPWARVLDLPCSITVDLALPRFRVSDLLRLQAGAVIGSDWRTDMDVGLRVNGQVVAWCEFEVVGQHLAARITELA